MDTLTNARLKEIASLKRKRNRTERQEAIVEGVRSVRSLLESTCEVKELVVASDFNLDDHSWIFPIANVSRVSSRDLQKISDVKNSQGIIAVVPVITKSPEYITSDSRVVALDGLSDPGNAGAIIRSAAWFGVDTILVGEDTVDAYSPKVVRASMGGLWSVDIVTTEDLAETLRGLSTRMPVYIADASGDDVYDWRPEQRGVLVIGNEAHGVRAAVKEASSQIVSIPRAAPDTAVESLNAAISCAILLSAWR